MAIRGFIIRGIFMFTLMLNLIGLNVYGAEALSIERAIELAMNHDPRVTKKATFVRQAEGLLDEARGFGGLSYSVEIALNNRPEFRQVEAGLTA
ncbi:MAG: hypothetical protein ACI845_002988 [Gammaproteobacteria bacterium]|jgi:hypothetical protein